MCPTLSVSHRSHVSDQVLVYVRILYSQFPVSCSGYAGPEADGIVKFRLSTIYFSFSTNMQCFRARTLQ
jgi:hypothetical protein